MIELNAVEKSFDGSKVVNGFSLTIEAGEFCVLIGPSGCGKSTVLRMINGLIDPDSGVVKVRGETIASLDQQRLRRSIGYVIQSVGLFPHWTIADNIATVPRLLGWPEDKVKSRVADVAALVQLPSDFLARHPRQLSGGQKQRVGVARALAGDPDIILMDEPFGALDPITRDALQRELRRIQIDSRKTIVFVTHDMEEALRLGDKIVVMQGGRVVQEGRPTDVLQRPANDFVQGFIGGAEWPFRLLAALPVSSRARADSQSDGEPISANASLKDALGLMTQKHCTSLRVVDENGRSFGVIHLADLIAAGRAE